MNCAYIFYIMMPLAAVGFFFMVYKAIQFLGVKLNEC